MDWHLYSNIGLYYSSILSLIYLEQLALKKMKLRFFVSFAYGDKLQWGIVPLS